MNKYMCRNHLPKKSWRSGWQAVAMFIAEVHAATEISPSMATNRNTVTASHPTKKSLKERKRVCNAVIN